MQRIRPATIAALSVGRRNEELWCDSLTNGLWQDPGSHKDRTVLAPQWTDRSSMCVFVCVCVCVCVCACFFPFVYPVKCGWACLLCCVTVKHTQATPGGPAVVHCWGLTATNRWVMMSSFEFQWENFTTALRWCHSFIIKERVSSAQMQSLWPTIKGSVCGVIFDVNGSRWVRFLESGGRSKTCRVLFVKPKDGPHVPRVSTGFKGPRHQWFLTQQELSNKTRRTV